MAEGFVLDPTGAAGQDNASPGPDAGPLRGRHVGIRVDRIWRAWDWISAHWAEELRAGGARVSFWRSTDRSGAEGERQSRELEAWLATLDGAILGLANCGSCTGWTIRDAIAAANTGIPTIAIATRNFEVFAHELAARGGRSGLRLHVLPYPLNERARGEVEEIGRAHFVPMLAAWGASLALQERAA